ncbi:lysine--tRNA ligase [Trichonephila clavipes]|nr:lysine--tRNA ligase [Trichonephila clavipes]
MFQNVAKEKFSSSAEYHEMRCRQKHQLKKGGRNPYPHDFEVTISLEDFVNKYANNLENGQALKDDIVSGKKGTPLQIIADAASYFSKGEFLEMTDMLKRGDVIGIKDYPYRSNSGELSILAINMQMIALYLHLIPDSYYGFKSNKARFKERCVELFMNVSSQKALIIHSDIRTFLRNYLAFHKFFDADTPKFSKIPGGANAKSFKTHYNVHDMDLYLRVSPELYLKKLCVGGFKRVFEIGPVFRNEGIDRSHHPEFTTCEFYMTDGSHNDLLRFVENLLTEMVKKIKGSCIFKYNSCGKEYDIDFTPPFKRIKIWPALEEALDMKLPDSKTLYSAEANQIFSNLCIKHGIEFASPRTTARLINKLIEHISWNKL